LNPESRVTIQGICLLYEFMLADRG
jgi:hypothetical protein